MTIEDRIRRNDPLDQKEIGLIIENSLKGNFGLILKAIIEGMKDEYLAISESTTSLAADRTLGRIEALNKLQDKLDYAVDISNQLRKEVKEEKEVK